MGKKPRGLKANSSRVRATPARKRNGQLDLLIHQDIYAAIINHKIAPGMALQEDALAQAFGVSRTVVRKVLQKLAHEKLVDLFPNRGAFVAKPSAEEARDVFEARRRIETIVVGLVVERATDEDIDALVDLAAAEKSAVERGNKKERVKLSGDFHRELAVLTGNSILGGILNDLISRTSLIIALYESPGAVPCSHNEHLEIAEALKRRDAKKAIQYMDHHIGHIEAQIDLTDVLPSGDIQKIFSKR
jgi:DNA-binding GntR family transcriptional regulator